MGGSLLALQLCAVTAGNPLRRGIAWIAFSISSIAIGNTDDNLRMSQVRALLAGQDWFDLRQYRLNPPYGANIHWSRFVDLPIAAIILALRPFVGGAEAERAA